MSRDPSTASGQLSATIPTPPFAVTATAPASMDSLMVVLSLKRELSGEGGVPYSLDSDRVERSSDLRQVYIHTGNASNPVPTTTTHRRRGLRPTGGHMHRFSHTTRLLFFKFENHNKRTEGLR